MQLSMVFSQRAWPGIDPNPRDSSPDLDDCWVLSAIQCVHACAPWLYLPSVSTFRTHAGDPDDGINDGGTVDEIAKGVRGLWPGLGAMLHVVKAGAWDELRALYDAGHPISLCVDSAKLPARLAFGFAGAHQVTIARSTVTGDNLFANPLAQPYDRPLRLTTAELANVRDAALAYGRLRGGASGIWAVVFPTDTQAIATNPAHRETVAAAIAAGSAGAIAAARAQGSVATLDELAAWIAAHRPAA